MMKAYPEYKESGLLGVSQIPLDWSEKKVKFVSNVYNGNSLNDREKERFENDLIEGVPYISSKDLNKETQVINYENGLKVPYSELINYKKTDENSTLLCIEGGSAGKKIAFTNQNVCFVNKLACFKSNPDVSSVFLHYLINSKIFGEQFKLAMTGMIGGVSITNINNFKLPFPSHKEQEKISEYLDVEIGRIRSLIAEKENFITLLQEKRQALISHVVTKGLSSNVMMKDSGVEWIGEIPEHWEVTKLRYLGQCQNGINIGGEFFGKGHPFISYGDVYNNKSLPMQVKGLVESTEKDRAIYSVKSGDVLFTRTSETIDEIGFTSVCHKDFVDAVFAGFLIRFRPKESAIQSKFSEYYFQNEKLRAFFVKEMNLVTRASLSQELLKRMPVVLPPENEQAEIASNLERKTGLINEIINETKKSIELLKERRTALISAAVTGKIDLREES